MLPKTINFTTVKLFRCSISGLTIQKALLFNKDYLLPGFFQVDYYLRNISAFSLTFSFIFTEVFSKNKREN